MVFKKGHHTWNKGKSSDPDNPNFDPRVAKYAEAQRGVPCPQRSKGPMSEEVKKKKILEEFVSHLKNHIKFEIVIGIVAAYLLYLLFGFDVLIKTLLSWAIGITLVATVITSLLNKYRRIHD